jgi:hypothetical protein
MVTAVLPRFFVGKQTSQPQGSRVIDWSNPLTSGLIGAFLPESPINFVDGEQMFQDWLPPTIGVRSQSGGKVISDGLYTYQPPSPTFPYGYKFDLTTGAALIVASQREVQNNNIALGRAVSSGSQNWGIGLHGGSFNGAYGTWGTFSFTPSTSGVSTLQKRTVIINADGSTATLYMDGEVISSGAYTMPAYDSSFRGRCFGFGSSLVGFGGGGNPRIQPSVGLVWNRPLTANEVALLTANPWQVFRSPKRAYTPLFDSTPSPTSRTFFIPRKKILSAQTQSSSTIDWSNSITRGLTTAFVPNVGGRAPVDLVTNTVADISTFSPLPSVTSGVKGLAIDGATVSDYRWSFIFNPSSVPGGRTNYPALSVFALFERTASTSFGNLWGAGQLIDPIGSGVFAARFALNDTGSGSTVVFVPSTNSGGATIVGPAISPNIVYSLGGVNEGNYRALYVDGQLYAQASNAITYLNGGYAAGSWWGTSSFAVLPIKLYCGYAWTRRLLPSEIKSLYDNPWQIFKQDRLSPALAEDGKVYAPFMS